MAVRRRVSAKAGKDCERKLPWAIVRENTLLREEVDERGMADRNV